MSFISLMETIFKLISLSKKGSSREGIPSLRLLCDCNCLHWDCGHTQRNIGQVHGVSLFVRITEKCEKSHSDPIFALFAYFNVT